MASKESEQLLAQAQIYQQQIQAILTQKGVFNLEINEIKKALEELEKTKETTAYKISGPILIKSNVKALKKDLKDKLDFLNLKIKNVEKQETMLKGKIDELREKLSEAEAPATGG
ncbi:MAG: prefoldin subunit beta [Candidatus Aenigmarchaeota archaeon]|nr:prefoldin subunit beta [Candidatus Aenigmarchaeota archaeon]